LSTFDSTDQLHMSVDASEGKSAEKVGDGLGGGERVGSLPTGFGTLPAKVALRDDGESGFVDDDAARMFVESEADHDIKYRTLTWKKVPLVIHV
jgi:hypothetical protein